MNYKNWSIQDEIKRRTDLEDLHRWATRGEKIEIPKLEKPCKEKRSVGLANLYRSSVLHYWLNP